MGAPRSHQRTWCRQRLFSNAFRPMTHCYLFTQHNGGTAPGLIGPRTLVRTWGTHRPSRVVTSALGCPRSDRRYIGIHLDSKPKSLNLRKINFFTFSSHQVWTGPIRPIISRQIAKKIAGILTHLRQGNPISGSGKKLFRLVRVPVPVHKLWVRHRICTTADERALMAAATGLNVMNGPLVPAAGSPGNFTDDVRLRNTCQ
jgi:hypothetical protein